MNIGTKLILLFLCIAAVAAGPAVVFMWHSTGLLYGLEQSEDGSTSPHMHTNKFFSLPAQQSENTHLELEQRCAVAADTIRDARVQMAIVMAVVVVLILVMGLVLSRLLTRPIKRLIKATWAFADGDLDRRVDVSGKDEFAVLGSALNDMAAHLQRTKGDLEHSNKTMEKRVDERALELAEAHERLRQTQFELVQHEKMSMLGQLAAGMAHEVNTPTAAILNSSADAAEQLRELLTLLMQPEQLTEETRRWVAEMLDRLFQKGQVRSEVAVRSERRRLEKQLRESGCRECRRTAEIMVAYGVTDSVDDAELLNHLSRGPVLSVLEHVLALKTAAEISEASAKKVARIVRSLRFYAHEGQNELTDVDVNETIDNTMVILQNRIKHLARLHTDFGENLPSVQCGPDLLQVWTNILSNACDAIEESDSEGLGVIEIVSSLIDDNVVVEISNQGKAIPDDVLDKLFDPFFTTKRVGKGTGLGLSICTSILERSGGNISVRNGDGRVTFTVSLPTLASRQKEKKQAEEIMAGASPSSRTWDK